MPSLPFSSPENVTSWTGIFKYANLITGDLFGLVVVLVFWVIMLVTFSGYPFSMAWVAASFLGFILSVLFWAAGFSGTTPLILMLVALIGGLLWLFFGKSR